MIEKRRHARATIDLPVLFALKGSDSSGKGLGKDISLGGMFIETETPAAFNAELSVRVRLRPPTTEERDFDLPAVVRWVRGDGMGVQFGLLGALETHAPGVGALVEHLQVITPLALEQEFGLTGGHIHHGELALDQLFTMRPTLGWADYRTPISGLYLCGSGTHPGNALTGASGHNAAREVLKGPGQQRRA